MHIIDFECLKNQNVFYVDLFNLIIDIKKIILNTTCTENLFIQTQGWSDDAVSLLLLLVQLQLSLLYISFF